MTNQTPEPQGQALIRAADIEALAADLEQWSQDFNAEDGSTLLDAAHWLRDMLRELQQRRAAQADNRYEALALALGYGEYPEGQGGAQVAEPDVIIRAWEALQRRAAQGERPLRDLLPNTSPFALAIRVNDELRAEVERLRASAQGAPQAEAHNGDATRQPSSANSEVPPLCGEVRGTSAQGQAALVREAWALADELHNAADHAESFESTEHAMNAAVERLAAASRKAAYILERYALAAVPQPRVDVEAERQRAYGDFIRKAAPCCAVRDLNTPVCTEPAGHEGSHRATHSVEWQEKAEPAAVPPEREPIWTSCPHGCHPMGCFQCQVEARLAEQPAAPPTAEPPKVPMTWQGRAEKAEAEVASLRAENQMLWSVRARACSCACHDDYEAKQKR